MIEKETQTEIDFLRNQVRLLSSENFALKAQAKTLESVIRGYSKTLYQLSKTGDNPMDYPEYQEKGQQNVNI